MSDTLDLIHRLSAEQGRIRKDLAGEHSTARLEVARLRLTAIAIELDALWDARRREQAGWDYEDLRRYGNSARTGHIVDKLGRWR